MTRIATPIILAAPAVPSPEKSDDADAVQTRIARY